MERGAVRLIDIAAFGVPIPAQHRLRAVLMQEGHSNVALRVCVQIVEGDPAVGALRVRDGLRIDGLVQQHLFRRVIVDRGVLRMDADTDIDALCVPDERSHVVDDAPGAPVRARDIAAVRLCVRLRRRPP